jgi:hypothetical protein
MSVKHEIWKQQRRKSKWSFIFWNGSVLWGLPMFIGTIITAPPPTPSSLFYSETSTYSASYIVCMLTLGCLCGLLVGLGAWWENERTYKKALEDEKNS